MSDDPLLRFLPAFGSLLSRLRYERNWTVDQLALAIELSSAEVKSMERGEYGPTLPEFFRIASVLGEEPIILLIDVISLWRGDGIDPLYKSRASDFSRLYRLGYYHDPGDFREHTATYDSVDDAAHAARKLNPARQTKSLKTFNTVCIYIRMGSVTFDPNPEIDVKEPNP
jgi:transcriptional regulator with XRE-family HTH domain